MARGFPKRETSSLSSFSMSAELSVATIRLAATARSSRPTQFLRKKRPLTRMAWTGAQFADARTLSFSSPSSDYLVRNRSRSEGENEDDKGGRSRRSPLLTHVDLIDHDSAVLLPGIDAVADQQPDRVRGFSDREPNLGPSPLGDGVTEIDAYPATMDSTRTFAHSKRPSLTGTSS